MTDLEGCIRYWESKRADYHLLEPSIIVMIELTIRFLKRLREMEGKISEGDRPKNKSS